MDSVNFGNSVPGIRTERIYQPREFLWTDKGVDYLPAGKVINGSLSRDPLNTGDVVVLRPGMLMGKTTTGGKYRPMIIGKSTAAYVDNDTTITVSAATATEVARLKAALGGGNLAMKFIGPPGAAGVVAVTAISVTNVTINGATSTLTVADLNLAKVTDSLLTLAEGSETPLGVLNDHIRVTDIDGNDLDCQLPRLCISGKILSANLINWPADASTQTYIKDLLNTPKSGCGPFIFSDNF